MGQAAARSQAEFLSAVRAAVERLFAHKKMLRRVAVRFGFWPDGLVISVTIPATNEAELDASRQAIVSWESLASLDPAGLLAVEARSAVPRRRAA
jgi:hypothetical protein